jgi:hypothetical protein
MQKQTRGSLREGSAVPAKVVGNDGQDLIALAQRLARDAERHAILSASLASQAERVMVAGIRQLERRAAAEAPAASH